MFQSGKKARNIWRIFCFVVQRPRKNFSLFQFSLWVRWKNIRNSTKAIKSTKSLLKNHEPYPNFQHSLAANTSIFAPDLKHISFETHISPFKIWRTYPFFQNFSTCLLKPISFCSRFETQKIREACSIHLTHLLRPIPNFLSFYLLYFICYILSHLLSPTPNLSLSLYQALSLHISLSHLLSPIPHWRHNY